MSTSQYADAKTRYIDLALQVPDPSSEGLLVAGKRPVACNADFPANC